MELKSLLSIAGLSCDLIGAFLLSIPIVWNTRMAGQWIIKQINIVGDTLIAYVISGSVLKHPALFLIELGLYLSLTAALMKDSQIMGEDPKFWAAALVSMGVLILVQIVLFTALFALGLFFQFVSEGNRERKFGLLGLAILCIGFAIQAVVNII
jgi:hypothetical protein